ncbi:hypothetical protein [Methylobacterium sp. B4]|uniref:hypothetical protein n=1 Tax=Methylobacterium sp. B4 TaxID=1938755 RepID=UPI000D771B6C|nr:hypothetical protein [Methylobacterium sp. B4]PXW58556.1 hypothetical protein BY998_11228 [Methylobacterium sp. B4]
MNRDGMGTKDEERAARLKAALRDNLRRRKAQARSRAEDGPAESPPEPAPGSPSGPRTDGT